MKEISEFEYKTSFKGPKLPVGRDLDRSNNVAVYEMRLLYFIKVTGGARLLWRQTFSAVAIFPDRHLKATRSLNLSFLSSV